MHINSCPVKCSRNVASPDLAGDKNCELPDQSVTLGRLARARIRSRITVLCETKDDSLGELPLRNVWSACSRVDKATSGALNVESEKEIDLEATQLILR